MKYLFTLSILLLVCWSCRKEGQFSASRRWLDLVKENLKDSMRAEDYHGLNFSGALASRLEKEGKQYVRIPFKGAQMRDKFAVVSVNPSGSVVNGRIVEMEGAVHDLKEKRGCRGFEGYIRLYTLGGREVLSSPIKDGYIEAFHSSLSLSKAEVVPVDDNMMPEVVVVAYVNRPTGISWSTWMSIQSLLGENDWGANGYYWLLDGGGGGNGSSNSQDDYMRVDVESVLDKKEIDLQKYIKCFTAIPDAGSKCSIEIFADIPVDNDPNKIFDIQKQSPGHTFIQIKKSNGGQSALQNIGFYPTSDWKSIISNAPSDGKFVDNGLHEFNASFKMELSPAQLNSILIEIQYLKNMSYDIDNYNCTDWALDIFNKVRSDKLNIPLYDIPGNVPSHGTRTPNGLYNRLKEMKNSNHPESANINYDFEKGYVANSYGPCN